MNRPAYRTGGFRFGHGFPMTPWVLRILIGTFAVFFLQGLGILSDAFVLDWLAFSVPGFVWRPWTAVTYIFVHGGFGHLFSNMIVLFFFGPPLEQRWGSRFFLKYYLVTGVGGALFSVLLYSVIGPSVMVGASGACFGLLLAFALNWPDAKIYLYFLFPVPAKWFVAIFGLFTLWATLQVSLGGGGGGVAHWAHLGGLATGWVYLKYGERVGRWLRAAFFKETSRSVKVEKGGAGQARSGRKDPPRRRRGVDGDALDEVDRILDKIRESGMDSLTDEERAFLDEMSRRYRKTRVH
ncbi:MAG: rhomboid family intramembrane serine protease [Gemmatimonadota bacterium]|nr:rhomboid family intramembrane serine protease [Gemmatimonadota bacterium]